MDFLKIVEEEKFLSLRHDLWGAASVVSDQENEDLMRTFSPEELDEVLKQTKTETAQGTCRVPVAFFKNLWPVLKGVVLAILNGFVLGRVDISRLNFGILSLIPKVQGADSIKQYRPIALINVVFKLVAKAFASRLSPVAHRIVAPN